MILVNLQFLFHSPFVHPRSRIVSLFAEENELQYAVPGGLIGVGTKIDPMLTRADRLVGQVCDRSKGMVSGRFARLLLWSPA